MQNSIAPLFCLMLLAVSHGQSTWNEAIAQTIPSNADEVLRVRAFYRAETQDAWVIDWKPESNREYMVDCSTSLFSEFTCVVSRLFYPQARCTISPDQAAPTCFYRMRARHAQDYEESPFGFHPAQTTLPGYADNGHHDAKTIGVRWTRPMIYATWTSIQPNLEQQVYDFSVYDPWVTNVPTPIRILANIAPEFHQQNERCENGTWVPIDIPKYAAFVKATVERYDGDGIAEEDFPDGVTPNPIHYWQVGNEPQVNTRTGFATLQRITYVAIKEACPTARVLIGGNPGFPARYNQAFDDFYAPILEELAGQYVDIFDFHWYGLAKGDYRLKDSRTEEDVVSHMRSTLTANGFSPYLPMWITESGSYSGDPENKQEFVYQSEQEQACDHFKRFLYSRARGVEKVFPAFGMGEGFSDPSDNEYFDCTGFIYNGIGPHDLGKGVKKLAYYMYRKMTEMLEGADWSTVSLLRDNVDHLYEISVEKDGKQIRVAWWDYFDDSGTTKTKSITLSNLTCNAVTVTEVVPHFSSGAAVTNYASAFDPISNLPVSTGGTATFALDENPVIVICE